MLFVKLCRGRLFRSNCSGGKSSVGNCPGRNFMRTNVWGVVVQGELFRDNFLGPKVRVVIDLGWSSKGVTDRGAVVEGVGISGYRKFDLIQYRERNTKTYRLNHAFHFFVDFFLTQEHYQNYCQDKAHSADKSTWKVHFISRKCKT